MTLFRNIAGQICVPISWQTDNVGQEGDSYVLEKTGGPGRIFHRLFLYNNFNMLCGLS